MKRLPKLFISYAHDSESYADAFLGFSDKPLKPNKRVATMDRRRNN